MIRNAKLKELCCIIYNFKNGFGWKHGLAVTFGSKNVILNHIKIRNHGENNSLFLGDGCRLHHIDIVISGNHNTIVLGDGCSLNQTGFYMEEDYNEIRIGNKTTTTAKVELSAIEGTRIIIGEDGMLSSEISIATGDGHSVLNGKTGVRTNQSADIEIGAHVWIGHRAMLNKGVTIPDNSIVAAGSICSRQKGMDEDGGVVLAGNPARIVKRGINWDRSRG